MENREKLVPLEKITQRAICDYLALKNFFFWRANNIPVYGQSNDGKRRFRALPKYTPRGLPDIIVLYKGKFIAIEVKREGMKLRPEQGEFGCKCSINGGFYYVAHSVEDVQNIKELQ